MNLPFPPPCISLYVRALTNEFLIRKPLLPQIHVGNVAHHFICTWHFLDIWRQYCTEDCLHGVVLVAEGNSVGGLLSPIGLNPVYLLLCERRRLELLWNKQEDLLLKPGGERTQKLIGMSTNRSVVMNSLGNTSRCLQFLLPSDVVLIPTITACRFCK